MAGADELEFPSSYQPHTLDSEPATTTPAQSQEEVNDNPIDQVRLTVPTTDDPTLPALTFRTWVLGIISCFALAFLNQFFGYRRLPLYISSVSAQIVVLPLGQLMAATLPTQKLRLPGMKWSFSMNPGPFNIKEHVLITIFAGTGSNSVYAVNIITIVKAFYFRPIYPMAAFLLSLTTQDSVTMQQIGSGQLGLGVGSFAFDWAAAASFLQSPLATPGFAIINVMVGFIIVIYILLPITYWANTYEAKKFPIFSPHVFSYDGQPYNVSRILNSTTFTFDQEAYDNYSKVHLSIFFIFAYGLSFATLAATLTHVALFHGRSIWQQTRDMLRNQYNDVHTRLMKKNYSVVPQWWFYIILAAVAALSMLTCEGFDKQLQLPYWGIILAMGLAFLFTLPIGIITATTNQQPGLNVITELIIGYLYPGKPLANVAFKTYGYVSMSQAIMFLADFKLGHYMKVPPKSMFIVQLVGTILSSSVYFGTAWWLLTTVKHICHPKLLPEGSPWTCPGDDIFYNASIIWGVVGPLRMFGSLGLYAKMNYFFLIGALAPVPVWVLSRMFPKQKWISLINMPVILSATSVMPQAGAVNFWCWGVVGIFFNFYVYRKFRSWWARHNYVLSAALDAGVAFCAILAYVGLQMHDKLGIQWWGLELDDHCPLASCPTAPGVLADGCPVFS
ncbi:hypothetical protein Syun_010678 [Stephania yunnanensis]|uniref:Oligopeptide transporter n=1 Tax=Stephania yunnanensis TaxID=152371 RepID=A0AAP0KJ23_9MAGN